MENWKIQLHLKYLDLDEGMLTIFSIYTTCSSEYFDEFALISRICPGRYYADAGMWIAMACILACYDILPCIDEYGEEIIPKLEFTDGFTT